MKFCLQQCSLNTSCLFRKRGYPLKLRSKKGNKKPILIVLLIYIIPDITEGQELCLLNNTSHTRKAKRSYLYFLLFLMCISEM